MWNKSFIKKHDHVVKKRCGRVYCVVLGIFRIETSYGPAYLHSGDAIGYFAGMVYFPDQEITISWAVNGNYGKVDELT